MSDAAEILQVVHALVSLAAPDPESVSATLGLALTHKEKRLAYDYYAGAFAGGPFANVDASHRADAGYGMVVLFVRGAGPHRSDLDLSAFGELPILDLQSPSVPDPSVSYRYKLRGGALVVIFEFSHSSSQLRRVVVRWEPVEYPAGEEPVFTTAPALLYVQSYERIDEVLEYTPKTRASRVISKSDVAALGVSLTLGYFAREGSQVAGYFATPDGPAFFHDKKRFLGAFGKVSGRIEPIGTTTRRRFKLSHRTAAFDLVYEERHGVGTNPYDTEEADVDLFAFIVSRLQHEAFFQRLQQPWA